MATWWEITWYGEPTDEDRERAATMIREGFTSGQLVNEPGAELRGGPAADTVYTLETWDKHGTTATPHATREGALGAAAEVARMSWEYVKDMPGVPADPDSLPDDEVLSIYYDRAGAWGEGYAITTGAMGS